MWSIALFSVLFASVLASDVDLGGKMIDERRGFEMRQFTLQPPYSGGNSWLIKGFTMMTPKRILLTRDLPSLHGTIWNRNPVGSRDWEAIISFRIVSEKKPADGLAFWYTASTGTGSAYGAPENFTGIGVAIDTYTNKGSQFERINVLFNRGDAKFDGETDGGNLLLSRFVENKTEYSCAVSGFTLGSDQHKPGKTVKLLVRYFEEQLSIYYARYDSDSWSKCVQYQGVLLPLNYHVGLSAITGDLHSAHEILSFKMMELTNGNHPLPVPSEPMYGFIEAPEVVDSATEADGLAVFWAVFKIAFYSALVAGVGFFGVFVYRELSTMKRRSKFY